MRKAALFVVSLAATTASTGCGFRIVRNNDVTARRIAQDSATISTLQQQLTALRLQLHTDSLRLQSALDAQRAIAVAPPTPPAADSALKARTAEVASLKDQLAKVSAELDRIKRRLANPRG